MELKRRSASVKSAEKIIPTTAAHTGTMDFTKTESTAPCQSLSFLASRWTHAQFHLRRTHPPPPTQPGSPSELGSPAESPVTKAQGSKKC